MARAHDLQAHFAKAERRRRMRRFFFWGVGVACAAGAVWWGGSAIVHTERFRVQEINVEGVRRVPTKELLQLLVAHDIQSSAWRNMIGEGSLLAWPARPSQKVLDALPLLREVNIQKDYGARRIIVRVAERIPFGIFCAEDAGEEAPTRASKCFWFDEEGILLGDAFHAEGSLIPVLIHRTAASLRVGAHIAEPERMKNILAIFDVVRSGGVDVKEVELRDPILQEVSVATYEGPALYFSIRAYPEGAASLLKSLKTKGTFQKLEYVDFRVVNRAYFK